ncbi:phosphopantothenoylcysteine decarboxylase [bacterium]|nr:phosphopantothenoylcysteine decarboxylase [bacterium]
MKLHDQKIVIILSGSIACYKVCDLVSNLVQKSNQVQCVLTKGGQHFITSETLASLSQNPVHTNSFDQCHQFHHIELSKWADMIIYCPASASLIARLAHGFADDLASLLFLADNLQTPTFVFPVMNTNMYEHPTTQRNLSILKELKIHIIQPEEGNLACGATGAGRLSDTDQIIASIEGIL